LGQNGPEPPLADVSDAAVQLHHTCHSLNVQQFREASDGSAGLSCLSPHLNYRAFQKRDIFCGQRDSELCSMSK